MEMQQYGQQAAQYGAYGSYTPQQQQQVAQQQAYYQQQQAQAAQYGSYGSQPGTPPAGMPMQQYGSQYGQMQQYGSYNGAQAQYGGYGGQQGAYGAPQWNGQPQQGAYGAPQPGTPGNTSVHAGQQGGLAGQASPTPPVAKWEPTDLTPKTLPPRANEIDKPVGFEAVLEKHGKAICAGIVVLVIVLVAVIIVAEKDVASGDNGAHLPIARRDAWSMACNATAEIDVLANDYDQDGPTPILLTSVAIMPESGDVPGTVEVVTGTNTTGKVVRYISNCLEGNYTTITYEVADGEDDELGNSAELRIYFDGTGSGTWSKWHPTIVADAADVAGAGVWGGETAASVVQGPRALVQHVTAWWRGDLRDA